MRLIDAEALEEKIENLITRFKALGRKQVAEDYNFVLTVLSTAPTIEAKPVVHAHWEKQNYIDMYYTEVHCSSCGKRVLAEHQKEYKYCPFCGVQMDEKESD